jgi:hypothetical protein
MQLPPTTQGPFWELRLSILSLMQYREIPEVLLEHQYRMHH